MLKRLLIVSFVCWCLCTHRPAIAGNIYIVTSLGILPGGYASSTATSIDIQGEVAGYSSATNGQNQAFYWTQGGGLVGLGGNSKAFGVNNGNVVGVTNEDPFRWSTTTGVVVLPRFGSTGQANGVNNNGEIVGTLNFGILGLGSVTWSATNAISTGFNGTGVAINGLGQFVGYNDPAGYYSDGLGSSVSLGGLLPTSLSDTQFVAGEISNVAVYENLHELSVTSIGTLAGDPTSNALGINPLGTSIVGVSDGHGGFIYDIATSDLESLTSLLDPAFNGWTILSANAVNDNGQIVGVGEFNGVQQAVLLNPVPEPSTIVLFACGLVALAAVARRRSAIG